MKKIMTMTALAVVLAAANSSFAVARKDGAYIGANVGYASLNPNGKANVINNNAAPIVLTTPGLKNASGVKAEIVVGYESQVQPSLLLGGELLGAINTAQSKSKETVIAGIGRENKVSYNYGVGFNFLVGTPVSDTTDLYLKLGVMNSSFEIKHVANPATAGYTGSSQKKNLWGFAPGVRAKVAVADGWTANLDVTYTMYQSFKSKNFDTNTALPGTYTVKTNPRELAVTVGMAYKF